MNEEKMAMVENDLVPVVNYGDVVDLVSKAEEQNRNAVFIYEDPKGNKDARSHVYVLRQIKSRVDSRRKELGKAALEYKRSVDEKGKELIARVEAMIEVHATPLLEIESREKERVAALQDRLSALSAHGELTAENDSAEIQHAIDAVQAVEIGKDWQDFMARAAEVREDLLKSLPVLLEAAKKREAEAAELARLRAEAERREREERERKIADEAAEKARREAEEVARLERERIEKELEAERREAERKQREAQEAAEKAGREIVEAEQRAAQAAENERKRIAQEEAARKAEAEKRATDAANRERIISEVAEALIPLAGVAARNIAEAIAADQIPHTSITF